MPIDRRRIRSRTLNHDFCHSPSGCSADEYVIFSFQGWDGATVYLFQQVHRGESEYWQWVSPRKYVILSKGTSERINTSTHARCMRTMSLPTVRNAADAIKYHLNLARPSSSTTIGPTFLCYFTWWNDKIGCGVLLGNRPKSLQIEHALIFFGCNNGLNASTLDFCLAEHPDRKEFHCFRIIYVIPVIGHQ